MLHHTFFSAIIICYLFLKTQFSMPICRTKRNDFLSNKRCESATKPLLWVELKENRVCFILMLLLYRRRTRLPHCLTVCFCLWVLRFSSKQLFFILLLLPCRHNDICQSLEDHSRQMLTRTMTPCVTSSLVKGIPKASYSLSERLSVFLKAEEKLLLDLTSRHKMEIKAATIMTCGSWDRKMSVVWMHLSILPTFWIYDRNDMDWQI